MSTPLQAGSEAPDAQSLIMLDAAKAALIDRKYTQAAGAAQALGLRVKRHGGAEGLAASCLPKQLRRARSSPSWLCYRLQGSA